jgi:hypothetical protein
MPPGIVDGQFKADKSLLAAKLEIPQYLFPSVLMVASA